MKPRMFVPRKLDMAAFIDSGESLSGELSLPDAARLAQGLFPQADLSATPGLSWRVQGRVVPQKVGAPQRWLDVHAHGQLPWECQRCLQQVMLPIEVQRGIRFVDNEDAAAQLDADCEDDVLALSRQFDVLDLIEDELIMAQPLVPMHDACPTDLSRHMQPADAPESPAQPAPKDNPFAVLAALKKDKG